MCRYTKEVWLIRGILASIIGNYKVAKSDFAYAEAKDTENYTTFMVIQFELFSLLIST